MMQTRVFVAAGLMVAAQAAYAYQIVEGRYRVETAPGVFEDQLVVRCDDGRTLTVPWETKLADACGEGLMGERIGKSGKPSAATAAGSSEAAPVPAQDPLVTDAAAPAGLFDDAGQKEAMLAQIRSQFGEVPERYIDFKPGPDGLSMRLLPPLNEIVKRYEACRRAREPGSQCAADRDQAIAKLAAPGLDAATAEAPALAVPRAKPGKNGAPGKSAKNAAVATTPENGAVPSAQPASAASPPAVSEPTDAVKAEAPSTPGSEVAAMARPEAPTAPAAQAPLDRAAMEQKIAEEHAVCMRLKPKFECEQARKRALGTLERPKAVKPARPEKQAKAQHGQVAAASEP